MSSGRESPNFSPDLSKKLSKLKTTMNGLKQVHQAVGCTNDNVGRVLERMLRLEKNMTERFARIENMIVAARPSLVSSSTQTTSEEPITSHENAAVTKLRNVSSDSLAQANTPASKGHQQNHVNAEEGNASTLNTVSRSRRKRLKRKAQKLAAASQCYYDYECNAKWPKMNNTLITRLKQEIDYTKDEYYVN